jgi:GST-like protein
MLEECALPYKARWVDIYKGGQFEEDFLKISPNAKIPAIIDHEPEDGGEPLSVFETGAILMYLAEKTGKFIGRGPRERKAITEWLFWQVGGLGPMLGQHGHFKLYAPVQLEYPIERYRSEALRLYRVLDRRLTTHPYIAGDRYSVADMATFPWIQTWRAQEIDLSEFAHVHDWYSRLKGRPALRRGMDLGRERMQRRPQDDEGARKALFRNEES